MLIMITQTELQKLLHYPTRYEIKFFDKIKFFEKLVLFNHSKLLSNFLL